MELIYLDNAATTPIFPEVVDTMQETLSTFYGNPSSIHAAGRNAKAKLEGARKYIAKQFGALPQEIIFNSGGTEGDNTVLQGVVKYLGIKHIISSPIEHHAVLHPLEHMAKKGLITLHLVKLLPNGLPDMQDLKQLLSAISEKKLVSLMHINNEVGTMIDLNAVGDLCREHDALFHSDTVQSIGHYQMNLGELPVDFAVASAHKFHGPKGVGFLYVRKNTGLEAMLLGGAQERGMRAGTEAVHNVVGMEKALRMCYQTLEEDTAKLKELKSYCMNALKKGLPGTKFNGACADMDRSTHTLVNARLPIDEKKAKLLAFHLDLKSICCSKGSACQSGSEAGSHVLQALLSQDENKLPSLRFSFSANNTKDEIDRLVTVLVEYANS
jgi:cysteine desulfurase